MEAIGLIAAQVKACESIGVTFLCCPEGVLGGLADYASRPYEIAIDAQGGNCSECWPASGEGRVGIVAAARDRVARGQATRSAVDRPMKMVGEG